MSFSVVPYHHPQRLTHYPLERHTVIPVSKLCPDCGRPKLVDLYCNAGGASMGYHRAGFCVTGVDLHDFSRRYPFRFVQADALDYLAARGHEYAAAGASPPCQWWTACQRIQGNDHPQLIEPTRALLQELGLPYVIENVPGAPLVDPVLLCGAMFPGLRTYRHRLFESSTPLSVPAHPEHVAPITKMGRRPVPGEYMHVVGNFSGVAQAREAMGISWMVRDELREAIPPAYTEHLGRQLLASLRPLAVAA